MPELSRIQNDENIVNTLERNVETKEGIVLWMGETWAGLIADGMKQRQQEEGTSSEQSPSGCREIREPALTLAMSDLFNYSGGSWRKDGREKGVWQKLEGVSLQGLLFSLKK